jgi:hypothetical protein
VHDQFIVVGVLAVVRGRIGEIVSDLREIDEQNGIVSEVKWTTAKKRRVSVYSLYAEYLARLIRAGHAHFHIRVAPFNEYDHKNSGRGDVSTLLARCTSSFCCIEPLRFTDGPGRCMFTRTTAIVLRIYRSCGTSFAPLPIGPSGVHRGPRFHSAV